MTGLDKMKDQIIEDAKKAAEEKFSEAALAAKRMLRSAEESVDKDAAAVLRKGEADARNYTEKAASSSDLMKRTKILAAKQDIISGVLEAAYEKLALMDAEEYFALLLKLLQKYVRPAAGKICFSRRDFARMPGHFAEEIRRTAEAAGGTLELQGEGREVENGFILSYGGIEENCTFKAIFDSKRDVLSDVVSDFLFT